MHFARLRIRGPELDDFNSILTQDLIPVDTDHGTETEHYSAFFDDGQRAILRIMEDGAGHFWAEAEMPELELKDGPKSTLEGYWEFDTRDGDHYLLKVVRV